jgi:hypothetical protein
METLRIQGSQYASTQQHLDEIQELVLQLEKVCFQACNELEEAYNLIKKPTDERKENITFSC